VLRRGKAEAGVRPVPFDVDRTAVQAARRDPRRFDALYRKYVAQVYSFALYELRDHHAAEDVTADVFMRALRGLPRFREQGEGERSSFRVWLFQIARNAVRNERRHGRRHPVAPLDEAVGLASEQDVAEAVADRDQVRRALRAIDSLPAARRHALLLRFVNEMSAREIGEVMGKSDGAVRVAIHRGLHTVAEQLGRKRREHVD
jgi:RNA polymerase sigma-70 factor (ECF subfamily)